MRHTRRIAVLLSLVAVSGGCNEQQRAETDSAAGAVTSAAKTAFSVIDVDMGRHVDSARKISDKTDDFAPTDTIYASLHTSGTANTPAVSARWTFQDGSVLDERAVDVTTAEDAYTAFFIARPQGFAKGKYTLHVIIDGKEVRTKDVTVR
jgi:hypothetical protein